MSPHPSKKVKALADLSNDRATTMPLKGKKKKKKKKIRDLTVAQKRSQRIRARRLSSFSNHPSSPVVLSQSEDECADGRRSRSPSPSPQPISPPLQDVPRCDAGGQIPLGETDYYAPAPSRRFGKGPPFNATFGTLKTHVGKHPPPKCTRKTTTAITE